MDILHGVQELMMKKRQEILSFEEITQDMISCDREKLEGCMQQREQIIRCIDQIDVELEEHCARSEAPEHLAQILRGVCEEENLSQEEAQLLCIAREIRAALSRLEESDLQAALRLRLEQEQILEQIKSTNQGSTAKAARFFSNDSSQRTGGSFLINV